MGAALERHLRQSRDAHQGRYAYAPLLGCDCARASSSPRFAWRGDVSHHRRPATPDNAAISSRRDRNGRARSAIKVVCCRLSTAVSGTQIRKPWRTLRLSGSRFGRPSATAIPIEPRWSPRHGRNCAEAFRRASRNRRLCEKLELSIPPAMETIWYFREQIEAWLADGLRTIAGTNRGSRAARLAPRLHLA